MWPHLNSWKLTWLHVTLPDITWPHQTSFDVTWPYLTSPDLIWPHLTSCDLTWPHVTSPDLMWPHLTCCDLTWPHVTSPDHSKARWTGSLFSLVRLVCLVCLVWSTNDMPHVIDCLTLSHTITYTLTQSFFFFASGRVQDDFIVKTQFNSFICNIRVCKRRVIFQLIW